MPPLNPPRIHKPPNRDAITRSVASSTAIETGQRVATIEAQLRAGTVRFPQLALALNPVSVPARG